MSEVKIYETRPLKCWGKTKELREEYYRDYARAGEKGGHRWAGSGIAFDALVNSLGDNFYQLTGEPYGASVSLSPELSLKCLEAVESKGFARDLCAYMRNYWGSLLINHYAFGGEFPKPEFNFTSHFCCMHSKWYQWAAEEEGVPFFGIDYAMGEVNDIKTRRHRVDYVVNQCYEALEWLEKVTGEKSDDERLIRAVRNECEATSLWAHICTLNKAVPAPIDEKTLFSFYLFLVLMKSKPQVANLFRELKAELEDRIQNKIAALANERCRLIHHSQPPWPFLEVFRYMESYGAVSIGSYYTYCLGAAWELDDQDHLVPAKTPWERGQDIKTREDAIKALAEWNVMYRPIAHATYTAEPLIKGVLSIVRDWKADGAIMHYNRGCEGTSLHVAEVRQALLKAGVPVTSYEGNHADAREFDIGSTMNRIDAFMESLELKKR